MTAQHPFARLGDKDDLRPVLALMHRSFAYMDGVIDPPTSLHRLSLEDLHRAARTAELWVIPGPAACMILTPQHDTLYLGKMAIDARHTGQGLARRLINHAVDRARALGFASVTLQTRVELTANQAIFQRLGFIEIGRTAHPGYTRPTSIIYRRSVAGVTSAKLGNPRFSLGGTPHGH